MRDEDPQPRPPDDRTNNLLDDAVNVANVNTEKLDRLIDSNNALALAMTQAQVRAELASEREAKAEAARVDEHKRFIWLRRFLVAFFIITVLFDIVIITAQYYANKNASAGRAEIHDCVVAGGKCYKRQQEQQAGILTILAQGRIFAAVCAQKYKDLPLNKEAEAVAGCVDRLTKASIQAATKGKHRRGSTSSPATPTASASATPGAQPTPHEGVTRPVGAPPVTVTRSHTATATTTTTTTASPPHRPGILSLPGCTLSVAGIRVC